MEHGLKVLEGFRKPGSVQKQVKMYEGTGIELLRLGLKYFCLDYVSKIGVSVTECNTIEILNDHQNLTYFQTA